MDEPVPAKKPESTMDEPTRARHDANRAALVEAKEAKEAAWKAEDEGLAATRAIELERFDAGLKYHDAMMENDGHPPTDDKWMPPHAMSQAEQDRQKAEGKPVGPVPVDDHPLPVHDFAFEPAPAPDFPGTGPDVPHPAPVYPPVSANPSPPQQGVSAPPVQPGLPPAPPAPVHVPSA